LGDRVGFAGGSPASSLKEKKYLFNGFDLQRETLRHRFECLVVFVSLVEICLNLEIDELIPDRLDR